MNLADLTQSVHTLQQEVYRLSRLVGALQHPQGRVFVATRDSDAGAFTEQIPLDDASDLQTLTDGRTTVDADTGSTLIRLPSGVVPVLQYPNGDKPAFVDLSTLGATLVKLSAPSGTIGTDTTASDWTYTVKSVEDDPITTTASPLVARPNGSLAAASWGIGYYPSDGSTFVLVYAWEIRGTTICE